MTMKKYLTLLLAIIMCVSLVACGNSTADTDYSGTWVREEWKDEKTGVVINMTIHLYEDSTYKQEVYNSVEGYTEYQGEWEVDGDEIICHKKKLVAGEDPVFEKDGFLPDGVEIASKYTIVDKTTLKNGEQIWNKQH